MLHRDRLNPPDYVYPPHEWEIVEQEYYPDFQENMESIFSLGNGYLGIRGAFDEGAPASENATLINGFHETWPIVYGEEAFGFAKTGQTIINAPDMKVLRLYVDDEPLFLPTAELISFRRVLDMRAGVLTRALLWRTPAGKRVRVESKRIVSFRDRHLAAVSCTVTLENADAPVALSSELLVRSDAATDDDDPRTTRSFGRKILLPQGGAQDGLRTCMGFRAAQSGMTLGCAMDHVLTTQCNYHVESALALDAAPPGAKTVFTIDAKQGAPIHLVKYFTYHTSRSAPPRELRERAHRTLDRAVSKGEQEMFDAQRDVLDEFWQRSDVHFEADHKDRALTAVELSQAIRFNLFHILQASARAEGAGVPAKGLTGQAYEGHYFWDTEIYVLPCLVYTAPKVARNLLTFRYSMLGKARRRAREVNQKGALYPWRTINGEEASAYYAAGTAQYHINADIMYGLKQYVNATGDTEFLYQYGAEMLVETARFWVDLGFFSQRDGSFRIHGVTGPDEYTAVVDNNCFTNLMARENLRYALQTLQSMPKAAPEEYIALKDRVGFDEQEMDDWRRAAENMYIPYDERLGVHPQDDNFLNLQEWDFENTPRDKYPLLLHHHPLVIYRHKVIKQADTVLAMLLLSKEFTPEQKKRNFDYYDPLTTGDSSLSVGIQSILAAEIGYEKLALKYSRYAVLMDLENVAGNVHHGCHIASMGATWMVIAYGFGGMRDDGEVISFTPHLPSGVDRLVFSLLLNGQGLEVDLRPDRGVFTLKEGGEALTVEYMGRPVTVTKETPRVECPAEQGD